MAESAASTDWLDKAAREASDEIERLYGEGMAALANPAPRPRASVDPAAGHPVSATPADPADPAATVDPAVVAPKQRVPTRTAPAPSPAPGR